MHLIDAEADSVGHFRQWSRRPARYFLVRADDRLVENAGQERRCSAIREELREQAAFQPAPREILHHGSRAYQWVAEIPVRLLRAAQLQTDPQRPATDGSASPVRRSICG